MRDIYMRDIVIRPGLLLRLYTTLYYITIQGVLRLSVTTRPSVRLSIDALL